MAIGDPLQWIIIGVVVIVIFLWGPQKIPDLAKALGQARKEFDQASKEVQKATSIPNAEQLFTTQPQAPAAPVVVEKTGDQVLVETARKLGISVEGKTRDQISQEILSKIGSTAKS